MTRNNHQPASARKQDASAQQAAGGHGDRDQIDTAPQAHAIQEHMEVMASCGTRVGKVEKTEGNWIKLTMNDPQAGGKHHYIPLEWVERIDQRVHLKKNSEDVMRDWQAEPTGATAGEARP